MEHLGFLNIVDITGAVRVEGVATADVSYFSGFGTRKGHRENWLHTFWNFLFLFWAYGSKFIYR